MDTNMKMLLKFPASIALGAAFGLLIVVGIAFG